jgi:hypothetical protein
MLVPGKIHIFTMATVNDTAKCFKNKFSYNHLKAVMPLEGCDWTSCI